MTDRTLQIWEHLSDMGDRIIEESMIPTDATPAVFKKSKKKGRFSAFMNHPAMVAVLCAVVSLSVVAAIVMAGRGGPVTPPVVGTAPTESEISSPYEESEEQTLSQDGIDPDEYISVYLDGYIQLTLESFMVWSEGDGYSVDGPGFQGDCNSGEMVQNGDSFTVHMTQNCEFQSVTVYNSFDMTEVATATEPMIHHDLKGLYYVVLRIKIRNDTSVSCYDYVFPLTLCEEVEGLNFEVIYREEAFKTDESETSRPTEPEPIPADFASYGSIIRTYRKLVERLADFYTPGGSENPEVDGLFVFPNEQTREWYDKVGGSAFLLCPGDRKNATALFGYAVKDVNGDGVEELFLLTKDFQIVTLFTQHVGKPVLLEDFWNRKKGYVNENGQIMIGGSNGVAADSQEIYRFNTATGRLVLEEALGYDGLTEDLKVICYHQIGEEKTYISEEEFNAIKNQEPYVGFGTEKNRQVLKDAYVPLLSSDAPMFSEYDDVLGVFKQFLLCDGSVARDSLFEELMTAAPTENDRAILKELFVDSVNMRVRPCYTVKDLNFDGQEELILLSDELWVFALFTMSDGVPKDLGYTAGWGMNMGTVRPDATVCQIYQSKGQNQTIKIQRIVGDKLYDLEEFGVVDEKVWVDFGAESTGDEEIYFYQKVKGESQKIDGEAYSRLIQQYGIDEVTGFSTDAGFENVIPLLSDDDLTADGKG